MDGGGRPRPVPGRCGGRGAGRRGPAAILRRTIPAARQGPLRPPGGAGGGGRAHAARDSSLGARTLRLPLPRYVTAGARAHSLPPPRPVPAPSRPARPNGRRGRAGGGAGESPADGAGARTHGGKARPRGSACALPFPPPPSPLSLSSLLRRARSVLPPLCEVLGAARTSLTRHGRREAQGEAGALPPPPPPFPRSRRFTSPLGLRRREARPRPGQPTACAPPRRLCAPFSCAPRAAAPSRPAGGGGAGAAASRGGRVEDPRGGRRGKGGGRIRAPFPPSSGREAGLEAVAAVAFLLLLAGPDPASPARPVVAPGWPGRSIPARPRLCAGALASPFPHGAFPGRAALPAPLCCLSARPREGPPRGGSCGRRGDAWSSFLTAGTKKHSEKITNKTQPNPKHTTSERRAAANFFLLLFSPLPLPVFLN